MTEALELDQLAEAIAMIDRELTVLTSRELISADQVADVLLDIRSLLTHADRELAASALGA